MIQTNKFKFSFLDCNNMKCTINGNKNRSFFDINKPQLIMGPSWAWSYGSCSYNYLCGQCSSPRKLHVWVRTTFIARCTWYIIILCDKVCQWLVTGQWFSPVSSTNKTDHRNKTKILLKVALNTVNQTKPNSM